MAIVRKGGNTSPSPSLPERADVGPLHRRTHDRADLPRSQRTRMDHYAADGTVKRPSKRAGITRRVTKIA